MRGNCRRNRATCSADVLKVAGIGMQVVSIFDDDALTTEEIAVLYIVGRVADHPAVSRRAQL